MEIVKQDLTVKTGGQDMPCHIARPAGAGPYPAVVVVMEAFGLNQNIKNITDRLASEGFVTIAPNLYFRSPDNVAGYDNLPGADQADAEHHRRPYCRGHDGRDQSRQNAEGSERQVRHHGLLHGRAGRVSTAVRNPDVTASVPFYGGGMTRPGNGGGKAPIDDAANLKGPVMAFFGGKDAFIPVTEVDKFRDAIDPDG